MALITSLKLKQVFLLKLIFIYFGVVSVVANDKQLYRFSLHERDADREESVRLLNADSKNPELVVHGNLYEHLTSGQKFYDAIVMYIADKNGYRVRYELRQANATALGLSGATLKIAAG